MNLMAALRNRQRRWVPRVGGAILVVWLNMFLQPCAMALGSEHDCPHCPPPMHGDCDGPPERCTYIDRIDYDGRVPKVEVATGSTIDAVFVSQAVIDPVSSRRLGAVPAGLIFSEVHGPPINVRFCIYLN